jgi:hypothetical protein
MVIPVARRSPRARRRARAHAGRRGATLIVVVLVITLLMGIGAFAARSAHLATTASGYERHMTQTRYVAEYGLMMATGLLGGPSAQSYLKLLSTPTDRCYGQVVAGTQVMTMPTCYKLFYSDVQAIVSPFNLCELATATYPGSLGMANAQYNARCDFSVELTDKVAGMTPPGFDTGPGKPLKFWYVTASVTAQVRILGANATGALDTIEAESSGTQTLRSRILAGPFPAN